MKGRRVGAGSARAQKWVEEILFGKSLLWAFPCPGPLMLSATPSLSVPERLSPTEGSIWGWALDLQISAIHVPRWLAVVESRNACLQATSCALSLPWC